jgi:hypothetical protein
MLLDTGVVPPPIVILKSHDAKLEEHNQVLHNIIHQLDRIQSNKSVESKEVVAHNVKRDEEVDNVDHGEEEEEEELLMDVVMNDLTNSREFVEGIVNKIVNETNLSEVIMKIEPLVKENQELRSLIHSQQQMMNEMNTMLLRLLNQDNKTKEDEQSDHSVYQDNGLDVDGLYQPEMTEIVLSHYHDDTDSNVDTVDKNDTVSSDVNDENVVAEKEGETKELEEEPNEIQVEQTEKDDIIYSIDPTDQDQDYSLPHFPEPISLVVTDIQRDS